MIKAILFDVGGVIVTIASYKKTFMKLLHELTPRNTLSFDDIYAHVFPRLEEGKLSEKEAEEIIRNKLRSTAPVQQPDIFAKAGTSLHLKPTVMSLIKQLKNRNYRLGIFSNALKVNAARHKRLGHYTPFDHLFLSFEIGKRKPNKDAFLFVTKILTVKLEEILFIDDSLENIVMAKKLGMQTIHFRDAPHLQNELALRGIL